MGLDIKGVENSLRYRINAVEYSLTVNRLHCSLENQFENKKLLVKLSA